MIVVLVLGLALGTAAVALTVAMYRRDEPILGVAALAGMLLAALFSVAYGSMASI